LRFISSSILTEYSKIMLIYVFAIYSIIIESARMYFFDIKYHKKNIKDNLWQTDEGVFYNEGFDYRQS